VDAALSGCQSAFSEGRSLSESLARSPSLTLPQKVHGETVRGGDPGDGSVNVTSKLVERVTVESIPLRIR
jgi:hypothetical protein